MRRWARRAGHPSHRPPDSGLLGRRRSRRRPRATCWNRRRREKRAAATAWQAHSQQLAVFSGSLAGVDARRPPDQGTAVRVGMARAVPRRRPHRTGRALHPASAPGNGRANTDRIDPASRARRSLRHHGRSIVCGIFIICGGTVSTYVFTYMTTYAITTLGLSAAVGTTLTLTGAVAAIAGFALGAWADRFGRKRCWSRHVSFSC